MEEFNNIDQINTPSEMSFEPSPTNFQKLRKVPIYKNKTIDLVMVTVVLFVLAGFLAAYNFINSPSGGEKLSPLAQKLTGLDGEKDPLDQKEVVNPITGELFTKAEASPWINDRPLGVMVNNFVDARPQSGLTHADIVYEVVAEGGITRFLAFFLSDLPEKVGPIRSTREYYLVLVKELGDAMLMHEGYSPQALAAIESWPVRSLQRGGASFINWRDNPRDVAVEHTLYSNPVELKKYGNEQLGWAGKRDFDAWKFQEEVKPPEQADVCFVGECKPITIDFWYEGDYSAIWEYNKDHNTYMRFTGYDDSGDPIPHVDQDTGDQIEVKTLIVQFAKETPIVDDEKNRLEYELIGSGEGFVFTNGGVTNVTWAKAGRDDRTIFYDENGQEMIFNRGKFWVSLVPERNKDQVNF